MRWDGAGEVLYRRKGGHDTAGQRQGVEETFDPAEFLARVMMHVPEPRRHLVRYYGWYSNASRGKRKGLGESRAEDSPHVTLRPPSDEQDRSSDARALRRRWAEMIKRVYEVDPLVCPSCGGEMRVVAFIIDEEVVDKILRHLARNEPERERGPPRCLGSGAH
jgi:hypothetical protein